MFNARSYSDFDTYGKCPQSYFYRVIRQLQRKKRDKNLVQGIIMHEGMMVGFLAMQDGLAMPDVLNRVVEYFGDLEEAWKKVTFTDEQVQLEELIEESLYLVSEYFERHVDLSWEILHVEEQFISTLENGEVISYTPDLVVRDIHGYVWIVDHKSTQSVPSVGVPFADLQALMYFTGVKALYPEARGFIFNYLRKKLPVEPRLTKTKNKATGQPWVAAVKTIDTTFEILSDFVQNEAPWLLGDPDTMTRMDQLRDNNRFFYTETIIVSPEAEESVLKDINSRLGQIQVSETGGAYPRTMRSGWRGCEGCEFQPLCRAELLGWNSELVLQHEYEPRDAKNVYYSEGE